MSRDDLLAKNAGIVRSVVQQAAEHSPGAIFIIVTNPLDAMCHVALEASAFSPQRVIGMAGVLDSARFRTFIAQELDVSVSTTHAFVLGGHGDTMVPLPRYSTAGGVPITELLDAERIEALVKRTRNGGAEIVGLLKSGSAYYAPAASVAQMVDSILNDRNEILPCAAYLNGEYGVDGLYVGVPVKLGRRGITEVVEIELSDDERAAFDKSAAAVRELVDAMDAHGRAGCADRPGAGRDARHHHLAPVRRSGRARRPSARRPLQGASSSTARSSPRWRCARAFPSASSRPTTSAANLLAAHRLGARRQLAGAADAGAAVHRALPPMSVHDRLVAITRTVIEEAAERGNAVIVGRGAAFVLGKRPGTLHVQLHASLDARVRYLLARVEDHPRGARSPEETLAARALPVRRCGAAPTT